MVKSDVKGNGKATYLFDAEKGRLASANVALTVQGTLKMELAGNEAEIGLSLDNTSAIRVLDTDPLKK
jgi:hypothetical protein